MRHSERPEGQTTNAELEDAHRLIPAANRAFIHLDGVAVREKPVLKEVELHQRCEWM